MRKFEVIVMIMLDRKEEKQERELRTRNKNFVSMSQNGQLLQKRKTSYLLYL